ncbi:hypothetical protein OTU49_006197 [Cherax quadricarinatus]|uniref:Uncharacterized protein n=1 Tax=Cherax quadricarinatus TaxID=27406 RepID=A0AAW0WP83_CHEQU
MVRKLAHYHLRGVIHYEASHLLLVMKIETLMQHMGIFIQETFRHTVAKRFLNKDSHMLHKCLNLQLVGFSNHSSHTVSYTLPNLSCTVFLKKIIEDFLKFTISAWLPFLHMQNIYKIQSMDSETRELHLPCSSL